MKLVSRAPLSCISVSTSSCCGVKGPELLREQQMQITAHDRQRGLEFVRGRGESVPASKAVALVGQMINRRFGGPKFGRMHRKGLHLRVIRINRLRIS